jgi:hypothetical protein
MFGACELRPRNQRFDDIAHGLATRRRAMFLEKSVGEPAPYIVPVQRQTFTVVVDTDGDVIIAGWRVERLGVCTLEKFQQERAIV